MRKRPAWGTITVHNGDWAALDDAITALIDRHRMPDSIGSAFGVKVSDPSRRSIEKHVRWLRELKGRMRDALDKKYPSRGFGEKIP